MKPVLLLMALFESASSSWSAPLINPSLYCLRLPVQRGNALAFGRNMPTYTWSRKVPWVLTLTGKLTDANTLFTAWISERSLLSASLICCPEPVLELTAVYFPELTVVMLFNRAVQLGP